jgi:lysophospholipase L1-like esterase
MPPPTPAASRPRPSTRRRLALLLILCSFTTLLSLLLAEAAVRILKPQNLSGTWLLFSADGYVVNRRDASVAHQLGPRSITYRFNPDGFRGPPLRPAGQAFRLLILGDSFTFGFLLDEPDTAVARLQSAADADLGPGRVELINAAVGSWGAADYTAFIEDHAAPLKPDAILIFLNFDDPRRAAASPLWSLTSPGKLERQPFQYTGWMPRLKQALNSFPLYSLALENSHLLQLARRSAMGIHETQFAQAQQAAADPADLRAERGSDITAALFARLRLWSLRENIPILVASTGYAQPDDPEFGPFLRNAPENLLFNQRAPALLSELGFPFLDLAPAFRLASPTLAPYRIEGDMHPNEAGARLIADQTWPWLRAQIAPRLRNN